MRAADTNVLLRAFVRDDRRQALLADAFISDGAWVSHVVLAEVAWVLESAYQREPSQIAHMLEQILGHERLAVEDAAVVSVALERFRGHPKVEFADFLILECARKAGHLPLGTFDKTLARVEGTERL
jgi:predicted nucleic-acid-binding protein